MEDRVPPPTAHCHNHSDRLAQLTCPRCQQYCCIFCWHNHLQRCETCLRKDPAAAVPPVPWEDASQPWVKRYFGTLKAALSPLGTAPSFARPVVFTALRFALMTTLPLTLLVGIMPHTRTLMFMPNRVMVLPGADQLTIALDILRAMGSQLGIDLIQIAALWLPYVSLVKAYGSPDKGPYAKRALLYRSWLLPASALLPTLSAFLQYDLGLLALAGLVLKVMFLLSLSFAARLSCGLSLLWSIVAVMVAVVLSEVATLLALTGLEHLLPPLPAILEEQVKQLFEASSS